MLIDTALDFPKEHNVLNSIPAPDNRVFVLECTGVASEPHVKCMESEVLMDKAKLRLKSSSVFPLLCHILRRRCKINYFNFS